jgi:hypothetical protein
MGIFGTARDGKSYDVSFGKGGSAAQAHKAAAERAAKQKAARDARKARAAKSKNYNGFWR